MKRLRRIIFNILAAVSALMLATTLVMWIGLRPERPIVLGSPLDPRFYIVYVLDSGVTMDCGTNVKLGAPKEQQTVPDGRGFEFAGVRHTSWVNLSQRSDQEVCGRYSEWSISFWLLLLASAMLPAWRGVLIFRSLAAKRSRKRGHCPTCGYDLRATPERCPECGARHRA